ncbi:PD-(D/E)XK nuclease family protein [Salininema proteolyticum]|uniref:DNA 3'-5' helicase n=1 Tax=Salininema proteolyticum TaxID=1607685 RepID=A0ABV8TYG6_9ACTN
MSNEPRSRTTGAGAHPPRAELVPRGGEASFRPDAVQAEALDHCSRARADSSEGERPAVLALSGGAGTGKTETLVRCAVEAVASGTDPSRILVLGLNRRDTGRLRERINAGTAPLTAGEVQVFTVPALAHAVVKRRAADEGRPVPRLLTGPESDSLIRSLLSHEDFGWPAEVAEAAGTYAFTAQLRDLILRCVERGVSGPRLAELGRRYDRPLWTSASRVVERYRDTLAVQSASVLEVYDSAELGRVALHLLRAGAVETDPFELVLVDDFQDFTATGAALLRELARPGCRAVVAGNADEAVFGFQGGLAEAMRRVEEFLGRLGGVRERRLEASYSSDVELTYAVDRFARTHMAGSHRLRHRVPVREGKGVVEAVTAAGRTREAGHLAGRLRRAHLLDGVPWEEMAVVAKSASDLPELRRVLQHNGIPTRQASDDLPLASYATVRDLLRLAALSSRWESGGADWLGEDEAQALLLSPFGSGDPYGIRRLKRHIRRSFAGSEEFRAKRDLLAAYLSDPRAVVVDPPDEPWHAPAERVARLLVAASEETGVAATLWRVWEESGLADRLASRALSGDRRAPRADAELDAAIALMDLAADFEEKQPGVGVDIFADHILSQQIPGDSLSQRAELSEAVTLTTVHGSHGRFWDVVAVVRLQEGEWPNLRPRGSLLGAESLVELLDGREDVDTLSELLAEERRLFLVAASRARTTLLLSAVDSEDEQPSRFLDEMGVEPVPARGGERRLTLPGLTASLRRAVTDPESPHRRDAAAVLRRLAEREVVGADPGSWWGTADLTTTDALYQAGDRLNVSPSKVEQIQQCPLKWVLQSHGGEFGDPIHRFVGTLFHAAAERAADVPAGERLEAMRGVIAEHFDELPHEAEWKREQDRAAMDGAAEKFVDWWARDKRELVGVERGFELAVPLGPSEVEVVLRGSIDRLERDGEGRLIVVDIKTGKHAPTAEEAQANPQMASYQFAIASADMAEGSVPGGAELVYPTSKNKGAKVVLQNPLSEAADPDWARNLLDESADRMAGTEFEARRDDGGQCRTCSVKNCCPLWGEGKRVTD